MKLTFILPLFLVSFLSANNELNFSKSEVVDTVDVEKLYDSLWATIDEMITDDMVKQIIFSRDKKITIDIKITFDPQKISLPAEEPKESEESLDEVDKRARCL